MARSKTIENPITKATKDNLIFTPTQIHWNKLIDKRKKTTKRNLNRARKLIAKNILISASDGSAHTGVKTYFAFCFANRKGKVLYTSHVPSLVNPEYASSDRAELLGILSKLYRISKSHLFSLYTDSESSIKMLQKTFYPSTKTVMKSSMDVILEIQHVTKKLKTSIKQIHVKAHQDETIPFEELSIPAQLNVRNRFHSRACGIE